MRRMLVGGVALMLAGVLGSCGSTAAAPDLFSASQTLRFRLVAKTTQKLDSVVWTGRQFLYVQNTANTVWAAPPAGRPLHRFAQMPRLVEETRCVLSAGRHGFPSGAIFCHSPDNKIYEISADGSRETVFATLPAHYPPAADGALAFDTVGRFGYRLLAATGRSGGAKPAGGQVDAVDAHGRVQRVGSYAGPGGADELVIAPRRFGSVGGDALLTVDAGGGGGRVVALNSRGRTRAIAIMPTGSEPDRGYPDGSEWDGEDDTGSGSRPVPHRRQDGRHLRGAGGRSRQIRRRCDRRHGVSSRSVLDSRAARPGFRRHPAAQQPGRRHKPRAGDLRQLNAAPLLATSAAHRVPSAGRRHRAAAAPGE